MSLCDTLGVTNSTGNHDFVRTDSEEERMLTQASFLETDFERILEGWFLIPFSQSYFVGNSSHSFVVVDM